MLRQRIRFRTFPLRALNRVLVVLLALALIWGGVAVALLAVKVGRASVSDVTGYRQLYRSVTGIASGDVQGSTRAWIAGAGVLCFLLFGLLAFKSLPRPYRARRVLELELDHEERGELTVAPAAVEHMAELAASQDERVASASGRYLSRALEVNVSLRRSPDLAEALTSVQSAVGDALEVHGLPAAPVTVTFASYQQPERELA